MKIPKWIMLSLLTVYSFLPLGCEPIEVTDTSLALSIALYQTDDETRAQTGIYFKRLHTC